MMPNIDARLLTDSMIYHEFESTDHWHKPTYKESCTINGIRLEENLITESIGNGTSRIISRAIAFVYASGTTPFVTTFKRHSKIEANGKIYTINRVINIKEPFTHKIWSIELELI